MYKTLPIDLSHPCYLFERLSSDLEWIATNKFDAIRKLNYRKCKVSLVFEFRVCGYINRGVAGEQCITDLKHNCKRTVPPGVSLQNKCIVFHSDNETLQHNKICRPEHIYNILAADYLSGDQLQKFLQSCQTQPCSGTNSIRQLEHFIDDADGV
ncbi:hypothetical protein MAR_002604, partial [Mya arenaria]